jgi:AbrB family looped-hinge helix DNA binding protein
VTAQPLAPVIPSASVLGSRQRGRPYAVRQLPLASPVPPPSAPGDVVYGIARIDASGRICERAVITALGWAGGDRLTFTADAGVVTAHCDPAGMVTLPASGYLTIPAALRRRLGLAAGDQVLLAAFPDRGSLAACSLAVVDQAIRAHGSFRHVQGGRS